MGNRGFGVKARLVALAAIGCATLAIAAGLAQANPASGKKLGHFRGVVTAADSAGAALHGRLFARAAGPNNMNYYGGPVMHSDANYSIYWEPAGHSTTSNYKNVIDTYFSNVAAASSAISNDYSVATQYYDGSGPIAYQVSFGKRIVDTNPYPVSGCVSSGVPCLTDAQMQTELNRVISTNGLPRGLGTEYFIFTPSGVATCFDSTSLDCSSGGANFDYCAYHSSMGSGSSTTLYAIQPYAYVSGCNSGQSPNGDGADSTINVTSHENIETITDPLGNAWFDSSGQEIGDKCAWNFGSALGGSPGAQYNEQISSGNYWLQQEWSNASSGCAQRMSSTGGGGPTAGFTFSPSVPRARQTVRFDGSSTTDPSASISRYLWTFGDGRSATGEFPTHAYRYDGTYTVTLKVTDASGKTSSVSHNVTVSG
jgi:PKD repeat protein